jgi:hypothetical protein
LKILLALDEEVNTRHLTKDFNLGWWAERKYQSLFQNSNHKEYGGSTIISETVFAVGYDKKFIIAKQHPNNADTISWNNINEHETWDLETIPSDTLANNHSYVKVNGKWKGISNGRSSHNELFPDKKITYYYILDIRNYGNEAYSINNNLYKLLTEEDFNRKRKELGVDENLDFSIIETELQ